MFNKTPETVADKKARLETSTDLLEKKNSYRECSDIQGRLLNNFYEVPLETAIKLCHHRRETGKYTSKQLKIREKHV